MLVEGYKPKEAISKFASVKTNLVTYGENNPTPQMSISDMLCGFQIGLDKNWFSYKNFDAKNYEYRSSVRGGDMNWIVPNVILAFSSPVDKPEVKTINKSFKVFLALCSTPCYYLLSCSALLLMWSKSKMVRPATRKAGGACIRRPEEGILMTNTPAMTFLYNNSKTHNSETHRIYMST